MTLRSAGTLELARTVSAAVVQEAGEGVGVMDSRDHLTDAEWALIGPLLPPERGRSCRPAYDNRPFVDGMLWIVRTGSPWRELPASYGKWNSVYQRYSRWSASGIWDKLLRKLTYIGYFERQRRRSAVATQRPASKGETKKRSTAATKQPRSHGTASGSRPRRRAGNA